MRRIIPFRFAPVVISLVCATVAWSGGTDTFTFTTAVLVQGTPDEVFDKATGDITGWWDHSMSGDPYRLYVEPVPGGAFMEIFDEEGNGCRHAVVTYARRGRMLRYEGPLGLAGYAIHMVTTWTFTAAEEGLTRVEVEVHAAGEIHEGWPAVVEKTWEHFLGRLQEYASKP